MAQVWHEIMQGWGEFHATSAATTDGTETSAIWLRTFFVLPMYVFAAVRSPPAVRRLGCTALQDPQAQASDWALPFYPFPHIRIARTPANTATPHSSPSPHVAPADDYDDDDDDDDGRRDTPKQESMLFYYSLVPFITWTAITGLTHGDCKIVSALPWIHFLFLPLRPSCSSGRSLKPP